MWKCSSSSPKVWEPQAEEPTMLLVVGMEISRVGNGHHKVLPHTQAGPPHSLWDGMLARRESIWNPGPATALSLPRLHTRELRGCGWAGLCQGLASQGLCHGHSLWQIRGDRFWKTRMTKGPQFLLGWPL